MKTTKHPSCSICKYSLYVGSDVSGLTFCLRYPPAASQDGGKGISPIVDYDAICGEFKDAKRKLAKVVAKKK